MPTAAQIHEISQFPEFFELGLSEVWSDNLELYPVMYGPWLQETPARLLIQTDIAHSGLGVMGEKKEGGAVSLDKIIKGPTKEHTIAYYALAVILTHEALRWEYYGIFKNVFTDLPRTANERFNLVAYRALDEAFSTTTPAYQTFQGEPLVSAAHSRLDGGTWDNALTAGLSYDAIQDAIVLGKKLKNERGKFGMVNLKIPVVPVELHWIARTIFETDGIHGTANKDKNLLKGQVSEVHSSPYMLSDTAWFLFCSPKQMKMGMHVGDRPKLVFKDYEARTMDRIAVAYCSFGFWTMDSRGMVGSTGGS